MKPSDDQKERICDTCKKMLPIDQTGLQSGFYCCNEYYCSIPCLDDSFHGYEETWEQHYSDDGDCYWTEWEQELDIPARLEYLRGELRAERISYGELAELHNLSLYIQPGDVELLEAAGIPEGEL